jgi:hypothetical protein
VSPKLAILIQALLWLSAIVLGGCGGDGTPAPPTMALLAGNMGGPGSGDGPRLGASFFSPHGIAFDNSGSLYVADTCNNTIRRIGAAGVVTTIAGTIGVGGSDDGTGDKALFQYPEGIASDTTGNIYVADPLNHTIRKISPFAQVSTFAGTAGLAGSADGTGAAARFNWPRGVATNSTGTVYVADTGNNTIRKITPTGVVSTFAGTAGVSGYLDGTGNAARFGLPRSITTDRVGNIYVGDESSHYIRKITPAGEVSSFAHAELPIVLNGVVRDPTSFNPAALATDVAGNIYAADDGYNTVRKFTPTAQVTTLAGTPRHLWSTNFCDRWGNSSDGSGAEASFTAPSGIATDRNNNVYVADTGASAIRMITPAGEVTTFAGVLQAIGSADGTGSAALFSDPMGVAIDNAGNAYVADMQNNTVRKITPAGVVSTLAGTARLIGSTDGPGSIARFSSPYGVATDSLDNVYITDFGNNTVRKMTPAGVVSTFAGTAGVSGSADGTGTAASFGFLIGIATDRTGNVYVADTGNNTIRKITPAGAVSTFAGTAGISGSADGVGPAASFNSPAGIATDRLDNVYVADTGNNTIRKITPAGLVTTLAGAAGVSGSADGSMAEARFAAPQGIATDGKGNVFVGDTINHTIRKITAFGIVSTVVGVTGRQGFTAGALPGLLSGPRWVAIRGRSLYVTTLNGVAVVRNLP